MEAFRKAGNTAKRSDIQWRQKLGFGNAPDMHRPAASRSRRRPRQLGCRRGWSQIHTQPKQNPQRPVRKFTRSKQTSGLARTDTPAGQNGQSGFPKRTHPFAKTDTPIGQNGLPVWPKRTPGLKIISRPTLGKPTFACNIDVILTLIPKLEFFRLKWSKTKSAKAKTEIARGPTEHWQGPKQDCARAEQYLARAETRLHKGQNKIVKGPITKHQGPPTKYTSGQKDRQK